MHRWRRLAGAATALAMLTTGCSAGSGDKVSSDEIILGVPEESTTSTRGPRVIVAPEPPPADLFVDGEGRRANLAEPRSGRHLAQPDGQPPPPAIEFTSAVDVPPDLVFVLVIGSDARPKEDLAKTRADSVHLLAVNPATKQGTILGLPRDAWVEIPGKGRGKINSALALGGPDLLAATVRRTTGLPVDYYVLTGFTGLTKMVDELGGVDVLVERRMSDKASGAFFDRGWHKFTGAEALAFARNRNDVANGDFSRSANHGILMLSALAKMRAEVGDDDGLGRWIEVMLRHVRLDLPVSALPGLAALARGLDPARITNVVAPGRIGKAGRQSVVFLTKGAVALFDDLRADGVVGGATAPVAPVERSSSATPTTADDADDGDTSDSGEGADKPGGSTTTAPAAPDEDTTTTTEPGSVPTPLPLPGQGPSSTTTTAPREPSEGDDPDEDTGRPADEPGRPTTTTSSPRSASEDDDTEEPTTSTTAEADDSGQDEGEGEGGGSSRGGSRRGRRG